MPRRDKAFYDLEFSVDPGGARKDAHYIRGTLDEFKSDSDIRSFILSQESR